MLIHQINYLGPESRAVLKRQRDMFGDTRFDWPIGPPRTTLDLRLVLGNFDLNRWNIKDLSRFIILNHGLIKTLATPNTELSRSRQDFSLVRIFNAL